MYSKRVEDKKRIEKAKEMLLKGNSISHIEAELEIKDIRSFFKHNAKSFSKIRFVKREVTVNG